MHDRLTHRSPIDSIRISAPKGFHAQLRLIKGAILALPWLKSIRGTWGGEANYVERFQSFCMTMGCERSTPRVGATFGRRNANMDESAL